jgi:antitoxin StbD
MTKLLTKHIATMTEMREPHKVLERSGGEPVAVLRNSALVGYFVPAEAVAASPARTLSVAEATSIARDRSAKVKPVLDYLRDK